MENKLQQLTQKLYDEGLEKGRAEAERLVAEAKTNAAKIVKEAEAQAARLKVQHEDASYTYFHAGDVRFADLHADGVLDERDKTIIGDPNPDFTGSFANRFTMGRFALDVLCLSLIHI